MSYELYVYSATENEPAIDEISALLDLANWQWVPVTSLHAFTKASSLGGATAVGWDLADDIGDSVDRAVAEGDPELLTAAVTDLDAVTIEVESPYTPDPHVIAELRESDIDPDLVTRVETARTCYEFAAEGEIAESTVEFMWALASAVGVLTDGVLEDVEDGALLDCNELGE